HAFVALTAPIQEAIRKHYYGDPNAFAAVAQRPQPPGATAASNGSSSGISNAGALESRRHRSGSSSHRGTRPRERPGPRAAWSDRDYVQTLEILVGLLEDRRDGLRCHSAMLARHACALARQLGFPPREISHLRIAAYLHEVGKPPERHSTLLSKSDAASWVDAPLRLFQAVHLPAQVRQILAQLYEAWDGSGVTQGARREQIAPGARVLAAVDAWLELCRTRGKAEALSVLRAEAGRLFDPRIVSELERLQSGGFLRRRLECDGRMVLVAEVDAAVRSTLVEALGRAGLAAYGASSLDGVADAMANGDADVLVVGLRSGVPDVLALLQRVRSQPECAGAPVALLGDPPDPPTREQLLLNGLEAIIPLPLEPDGAARTLMQLHADRVAHGGPARVVIGGFDELPAREVLETIARHRKTGRLRVESGAGEASLQIESGRVLHVDANGRPPEEAVREIASAAAGEFSFDANALLMDRPNADVEVAAALRSITPAGV
ncbi:MAG TPA: HD domain-containing phosphohydrolase, partial [Myxococcaceae bacterium]|nr:HD domain-containing phosphohydrolase [Myxococcaceae bacterium]